MWLGLVWFQQVQKCCQYFLQFHKKEPISNLWVFRAVNPRHWDISKRLSIYLYLVVTRCTTICLTFSNKLSFKWKTNYIQLTLTTVRPLFKTEPLNSCNYINNFPNASKLFQFLIYAYNTKWCHSLNNYPHNDALTKELQKINTWFTFNKFSSDIDKTKLIIFYTKQRSITYPDVCINNTIIEKVKI